MNKLKAEVVLFTILFLGFNHNAFCQVEKACITEFASGSLYALNTETNTVEARIPLALSFIF